MNILFLSNEFPTPGEPLRAVFNGHMIRGLACRHRVHVVCPVAWTDAARASAPSPPPVAGDPFTVRYPRYYFLPRILLHLRGAWMWWSLRRGVLRDTARVTPDIVLSYWAHPDGEVALRLARRINVPVVLMVGGSDVLALTTDPRRRARITAVLQGVDAVVTMGAHLGDEVVAMGVPAARVTRLIRPVDTTQFHAGPSAEARTRLGLAPDTPLLLAVGRLVPVKAIDILLSAVALLRARYPQLAVCIAGQGPEARRLAAIATRLGLDDVVRWLGAVAHAELPDWYRAADVTVLPSLSEGLPNVLLESTACGTPFVASRVGSIPAIADDACDRLVAAGDPAALADAIDDVLSRRGHVSRVARTQASESEFQGHLDAVMARCVCRARPDAAPTAHLRSATRVNPNWRRQVARRVLVAAAPRRWLVGSGNPASRRVCLTFDDGPCDTETPRLLDALRREGVRATFFVRGDRAVERPDLVRRVIDEGHLLGHHSWSHGVPAETSVGQLLGEVRRTRAWIRDEMGTDSTWFRPPHGKVTAAKVAGLWAAGQTIALWNVDPGDLGWGSAQEILDWLEANPLRGGDVVLLHDASAATLDALPVIIARTRAAGLDFATLDVFGGPQTRSGGQVA